MKIDDIKDWTYKFELVTYVSNIVQYLDRKIVLIANGFRLILKTYNTTLRHLTGRQLILTEVIIK